VDEDLLKSLGVLDELVEWRKAAAAEARRALRTG
jgi:hypothetical protein